MALPAVENTVFEDQDLVGDALPLAHQPRTRAELGHRRCSVGMGFRRIRVDASKKSPGLWLEAA